MVLFSIAIVMCACVRARVCVWGWACVGVLYACFACPVLGVDVVLFYHFMLFIVGQ